MKTTNGWLKPLAVEKNRWGTFLQFEKNQLEMGQNEIKKFL